MASHGRVKRERDPRPVILSLQVQRETSRPLVRSRASVPKPHSSNDTCSRFIPDTITRTCWRVQDVLEIIKGYFECHGISPNYQTPYLNGHVLSAHGEVSNPTLLRQGLPVVLEGIYAIGILSGLYKVTRNGPVELDSLKIVVYGFDGQGHAGDVTGSLIAATDVQVMVSWISFVNED